MRCIAGASDWRKKYAKLSINCVGMEKTSRNNGLRIHVIHSEGSIEISLSFKPLG